MSLEAKGRWAVITGASAGIGKCIAQDLAARGCHLALVARRQELLDALASDLSEKHQIQTRVIAADLTAADAAGALANSLEDLPIAFLINNAGFAETGDFEESSVQRLTAMLQLNMVFLVQFTRIMLPRLKALDEGARIMNVGSLAGYMGVPQMCTYAATKAFVNHFSEGLAWELRDTRVRVTSLEPGSTKTEFFDVAGMNGSFMSRFNVMAADKVASQGVSAMLAGRRRLVAGLANKLGVFALRFSPRWMIGRVVGLLFRDVH